MLVAWKAPVSICIFVVFAFAGLMPPAAEESSAEIQGLPIADRPVLAPGDTWRIRYSDGAKAKSNCQDKAFAGKFRESKRESRLEKTNGL